MNWPRRTAILVGLLLLLLCAALVYLHFTQVSTTDSLIDLDLLLGDESTPPPPVPASPQEAAAQPKDTSALGGYDVLIADRGNNRLIEVTPDKKVVWTYTFRGLPLGYGADDAFFADGGKTVIVNLENYNLIEQIDYQTKKITWQYGHPGVRGSSRGYLFSPDDAYKLPSGDVIVADIKNCRVIEISPDKHIVHQYGKVRQCANKPGYLDAPNGDTPLPDGHILVSNILSKNLIELDSHWQPFFTMPLPLAYPSDPQMTRAGNFLIAEYKKPGKIIEISRQGSIVWEYDGENGVNLNKPSLAIELPNGNILANDDYNHRVIVIDKQTKRIIWQYGVTGKPGDGSIQLNIPDGLDIIKHSASTTNLQATSTIPTYTVGQITRHAAQYLGKHIFIRGYLLEKHFDYDIFSDEPSGTVSAYDLPVNGPGTSTLNIGQSYLLEGDFLQGGLKASNGNLDHLDLSAAPAP